MRRLALLLAALGTGGCESALGPMDIVLCDPPAGPPPQVDYALVDLPDSLLWYRGTALQSFDDYDQDSRGVVLFTYRGRKYYNPVQIAQRGMWFGDNYRRTGEVRYLERSEAHAQRLIRDAHRVGDALFFPYPFDFRLHGRSDQVMRAPWYSGMAQGQALSLFLRLHEWTGREEYLSAAHGAMASLTRLRRDGPPYVARLGCEGYYWIEEYPMEASTRTLNGFVFALYGVYEYWRATGDQEAEKLVRASLATLEHHLPSFRVPSQPSYYCLKHRQQYPIYHDLHVRQLRNVHRLSGNPYFGRMAERLAGDFRYTGE